MQNLWSNILHISHSTLPYNLTAIKHVTGVRKPDKNKQSFNI